MLWKDLLVVLFPEYCLGCGCVLLSSQTHLCSDCLSDLKDLKVDSSSEIKTPFSDDTSVREMISLFYYKKNEVSQKLIHELKYKGNQKVGQWVGEWLGERMAKENIFSDIDIVLPVPLHKKKKRKRGYNQVTLFGKMIAKYLGAEYQENVLIRHIEGDTQTKKDREQRYFSVKNSFLLKNTTTLASKNVLIVDDVVTTGATLKACIETLEKSVPNSISIATIAFVPDVNN